MGHHEMNGSLTSPGVYAGLHNISPQMSAAAAAAAAYGRPMVSLIILTVTSASAYLSQDVQLWLFLTLLQVPQLDTAGKYDLTTHFFFARVALTHTLT